MADLILWNPISRRRRSPSDDFLDNGLAILKAAVEREGFQVEVIDWARSGERERITPRILAGINHCLTSALLSHGNNGKKGKKRAFCLVLPLFLLSQEAMSLVQKVILRRMIRRLARQVRDSSCPVVGIKTWYGETYLTAKYFAKLLRKIAPEVLIITGGPQPSTYREAVLEDEAFDIAVVGEGERALSVILALARRARSKKELLEEISREAEQGRLENIIYRGSGRIETVPPAKTDANSKVVPVYDNLEGKTKIHVVVESLGCPWGKCNFCTHSRVYRNYSVRDPRSVVGEIEQMLARGIGIFRFAGSSTALAHARKVAALLEERGIRIIYSMFSRIEPRAEQQKDYGQLVDTYRLLLRTGFRAVFLGAESANDTVNELVMNKGIVRRDIVATIRAMREASEKERLPLDIGISLIHPAPTLGKITAEQLREENLKLVEQLNPDSVLVSPPAPFPGSTWFNEKDRFGFQFGEHFVREMIEYDYVLYKPFFLWPKLEVKLEGRDQRAILQECGRLRKALDDKGFVTEVTDVHFLILRAAGYTGKEGVMRFKEQMLLNLLSCNSRWTDQLQEKVNQASLAQASINKKGLQMPDRSKIGMPNPR